MSDWLNTIDIYDDFTKAQNQEITTAQLASILADKLRDHTWKGVQPLVLETIKAIEDDLRAIANDDCDNDEELAQDEFNACLRDLYDLGNSRRFLWLNTVFPATNAKL